MVEVKRCAVYTRKSSEEGLEQDFNSLHAQREACEAFIKSQAGEGWRLLRTAYDDGGFSGGTMARPALQQLLEDIRQKRVDVIVVYKVDRLTRSLADFAKMVEAFDQHGVSFVAVTQQFNTTTSMGRLTLNVLLSFAQFEREVTGERIRDKIAASKKKGLWMGGMVPLGYDVVARRLVINLPEAETVRAIYKRYLEVGSIRLLKQDLESRGIVSKRRLSKAGQQSGGRAFSRGALYELLANPIYLGEIRHRKDRHPGQHQAIVDRELWDQVQQQLTQKAAHPRGQTTNTMSNMLAGKLFDEAGQPLYVSGTTKARRRYRYYVSRNKSTGGKSEGWRLAAPGIERAVIVGAAQILKDDSAIGTMLHDEAGFSAEHLARALQSINACRTRLATEGEHGADTAALIDRVDLGLNELQLTLNLAQLVNPQVSNDKCGALKMKRSVPMQLRRRGVELRIVMAGETAAKPRIEPTLIKAIARGRRWFAELACNRAQHTAAIAQREGVHDSYVRRLLPLAFLAPSVVETICAGRQPLELTAEILTRRTKLPLAWAEQEKVLGLGVTAF
ncbi:MAG TPA: recombinase family protein [Candidatus Binataceae bacterium]|nr:recombinase family protein [Candidatus Binataceae bacterium]